MKTKAKLDIRNNMSLKISLPDNCDMKPRMAVFGVGGAGSNAVNNMIALNLEGVDFWVANTDAQAIEHSLAKNRIQLGAKSTKGLGAGSHPEVGKQAAEESIGDITHILENTNMVFITAGMGGGTGTGAAPVIAKQAKDMGILTVGVVTKPFHFEGARRMKVAELGLEELNKYVDTLIVIPNQNLFRIANENTTFADAFKMADNILHTGVRGITDLITKPGLINLDFADIRTVMSEMGKAMMGTGEAEGENRAVLAAEAAISNPLLDNSSMKGARGVLINITGGSDMTLFQVDSAANRIKEEVDPNANIIFGSAYDADLDGKIRVSVVATGIDARINIAVKQNFVSEIERPSIINVKAPLMKEEEENNDNDDSFIPPRPIEPNLFQSNSFSFAEEEIITENKPEVKNSFDTDLEKSAEAVNSKVPANDAEESTGEDVNAKSKEDFFDIPAFLRRKMKL
jgi:cell division protein FtsZ